MSEEVKQELEKLIPLSIAENIPIVSSATTTNTVEIRGCQVDYTKVWEDTNLLPGIYDLYTQGALEMQEAINVFIPKPIS